MVAPQSGANTGSVGGTKKRKKRKAWRCVLRVMMVGGWVGGWVEEGWRGPARGKEVTVDFKGNVLRVKAATQVYYTVL